MEQLQRSTRKLARLHEVCTAVGALWLTSTQMEWASVVRSWTKAAYALLLVQGGQLLPTSRSQAVAVGDHIWLHTHRCTGSILRLTPVGGDDGSGTSSASLQLQTLPVAADAGSGETPSSRGLHSLTAVGSTLYLFGGGPPCTKDIPFVSFPSAAPCSEPPCTYNMDRLSRRTFAEWLQCSSTPCCLDFGHTLPTHTFSIWLPHFCNASFQYPVAGRKANLLLLIPRNSRTRVLEMLCLRRHLYQSQNWIQDTGSRLAVANWRGCI